jgi:hypothetical protein
VGFALITLAPLRVIGDARALDERMAAQPGPDDNDPCALLALAESFLVRDAAMEDRVNQWWSRVATLAFNAGCVALLVFAFHRDVGAAVNGIGGAVIGQIMINTQPTDSLKLLERYRAGDLTTPERPSIQWALAPLAGDGRLGLAAMLNF